MQATGIVSILDQYLHLAFEFVIVIAVQDVNCIVIRLRNVTINSISFTCA